MFAFSVLLRHRKIFNSNKEEIKMRFAFYKKKNPREEAKNGRFYLSISNIENSPDKFYKNPENNLPENLEKFLDLARACLNINELPFFLLSEEELAKRTINSDFNLRVQKATGDHNTIYINLPDEVDYVHSFYNDNFLDDEFELKRAFKRTRFPQFKCSELVPLEIDLKGKSVKLLHSTLKNVVKKRYFLFIDNLLGKAKTLFTQYDPKLYEITKNLEDVLVDRIKKQNEMKTVALVIHGFMSKTEDNFKELKKALIDSKKYDRIFGYSYAPNKVCIRRNGEILTDILKRNGLLSSNLKLDIYAHSEGGLVARSMIVHELSNCHNHSVRNFITAGTPHKGTPFAEFGYRALTLPRIALIVTGLMKAPDPQVIIFLKDLLYYYTCFKEDVGLKDMCPNSDFLKSLQKHNTFNINGSVLLAGYHVGKADPWSKRIITYILDKTIFKFCESHDTVVPFESSRYKFTPAKIYEFNDEGWHSDYYNKSDKAKAIVKEATSLS